MATVAELDEAVTCARQAGCRELVLLKCTSTYPADPNNSNVVTVPHMRQLFDCEVGLSDHTMGVGAAVASVALGASVIEKHFTLSRAEGGVDAAFSLEPAEFAALVTETDRAWRALGTVSYGPSAAEASSLLFRRSLYFVEDLTQGEAVAASSIRAIRPGKGLAPKFADLVIGRRAKRDIRRGTPVSWDVLA
jgi:sialic acid synthase SpsE